MDFACFWLFAKVPQTFPCPVFFKLTMSELILENKGVLSPSMANHPTADKNWWAASAGAAAAAHATATAASQQPFQANCRQTIPPSPEQPQIKYTDTCVPGKCSLLFWKASAVWSSGATDFLRKWSAWSTALRDPGTVTLYQSIPVMLYASLVTASYNILDHKDHIKTAMSQARFWPWVGNFTSSK